MKALGPIDINENGIVIWVSDSQSEKVSCLIDTIDDGMVIWASVLQDEKALCPIDVIDDGIVICVIELHL